MPCTKAAKGTCWLCVQQVPLTQDWPVQHRLTVSLFFLADNAAMMSASGFRAHHCIYCGKYTSTLAGLKGASYNITIQSLGEWNSLLVKATEDLHALQEISSRRRIKLEDVPSYHDAINRFPLLVPNLPAVHGTSNVGPSARRHQSGKRFAGCVASPSCPLGTEGLRRRAHVRAVPEQVWFVGKRAAGHQKLQ